MAALAAVLSVPPTADASHQRRKCLRYSGETVVKNRYMRIFERRVSSQAERLYGCLYSRGRRVYMTEGFDNDLDMSDLYDEVTINGRFVAWQRTVTDVSCRADCPAGYDPTARALYVFDVLRRTRRTIEREPPDPGVVGLVVTDTGGAAWLEARGQDDNELWASDRDGERALDRGAISSLRARRATVSWTNAATPRSATLR